MKAAALACALMCAAAQAADRPRLAVIVVIDQLSAETFRTRAAKVSGGFKRLQSEGFVFQEARYEAAPTITSVGHATLLTGAYGATHGIVANDWIDLEAGAPRLSTEDARFTVIDREPLARDGTAPTFLEAPTLSDSVRLADANAKAVVISAKDRSAILCAGRAGLPVWFDAHRPFFTSSTFYVKELPTWVKPVNDGLAALLLKGAFRWGLPGGGFTGQNPQPGRANDSEPFAEAKELQPILDTAEVDLALSAVKSLGLGKDEVPDLLTISFSGHDRIGHEYGPDSQESVDDYLHVDRELGRLFGELDRQVGKGKYLVVLSSDHGVAPLPELAKERGLDAGRLDAKKLMVALDAELDAALGPQDWFLGMKSPGLTLTPALRAKALTQLARLQRVARAQEGVLDLQSLDALHGPLGALFAKGARPGRSPDLFIITKPYWTYNSVDKTGHGSPYLYDRSVPLVFFGAGIKPGKGGVAEVIDVAPTVARFLEVPPPAASVGRPLEALWR